ncbi:phage portal protein [Glutamicibacter sp. NPDC087583]|uniref:phage portal protein n=1 Tax=Glutamicibacter sp. NPDC087583 TaxID=3363995 RepID=UPI003809D622
MGILSIFRKSAVTSAPRFTSSEINRFIFKMGAADPETIYASQSNVRAAVDFIANQVALTGLTIWETMPDGTRRKSRDSVTAKTLASPNPAQTGTEWVRNLTADFVLNSDAWQLIRPLPAGGFQLRPLTPSGVSIVRGAEIDEDLVIRYGTSEIEQRHLLHFAGFTADHDARGLSPVDTLRAVLAEQIAAQEFRLHTWKNGGQIQNYVSRPANKDAPWDETKFSRFKEAMAAYRSGGGKVGGMPILEDGMKIESVQFNAKEAQWLESNQLALELVCRVFGINPAHLGSTQGLSYANLKDFRKSLYGESLGPILRVMEERFTQFLIPRLDPDKALFAEFNVKERLRDDPVEQASIYFQATGRPYRTVNEVRAMENLQPVEGGDVLAVPLNLLVAGQTDAPAPAKAQAAIATKAAADEAETVQATGKVSKASEQLVASTLDRFFKRQQASVLAKLNAKADAEWWDSERWDRELAADLLAASLKVTEQVATDLLVGIDADPGAYSSEQTEAFLAAVAAARAVWINSATQEALQEALDDPGEDEDGQPLRTPERVFKDAQGERGKATAATLLTTLAAFATKETAEQVGGSTATKTWRVTSSNPRSEHVRMNGETVPAGEPFSNGAQWPGDPSLGADGVAGCRCAVEVSWTTN